MSTRSRPRRDADRREPRAAQRLREVASNSDNIDYGEMIHAQDGTEEGITTFTDRGIESLQELLADVRTWNGVVRQFLLDQQCEPHSIERIMAKSKSPDAPRPTPDAYTCSRKPFLVLLLTGGRARRSVCNGIH